MKHLFLIMFSLTTLAKPGISQKKIIVRLNDKQLTHTIQKSGNYIKVAFNDNVMNTFFEKHKIMAFEQAFPLANRFNHPLSKRVSEMYRFTFENTDIDILNKLKEEQYFDFIDEEKDPILLFTPNDLSIQGGLAVLALNKINATEAWDVTKGSASIKIAIIDNGYDVSHPDLANQIVYQDGSVSYGGVGLSHGLPVAGLAAAQTDNGIGVSSIGFNSKLMLTMRAGDGILGRHARGEFFL